MGAENRMNYTVLGKNVNLAARLCQSAKPGQLIISEYTYRSPNVEHKFVANPLEPLLLKGFAEPVPIYEITGLKASSI
jgi:adenylate cyclase